MTNKFSRITVSASMDSKAIKEAIQIELDVINKQKGTVTSIQEYLNEEMFNVVIIISYNI